MAGKTAPEFYIASVLDKEPEPVVKKFYGDMFVDLPPSEELCSYIASYWFLHNRTSSTLHLPVVPDGSSDIIFPFGKEEPPFVVGLMTCARTVPIPAGMKSFGVRFQPAILSFLLGCHMQSLTDRTEILAKIDNFHLVQIEVEGKTEEKIISLANEVFEKKFQQISFDVTFLQIVKKLTHFPESSISELAKESDIGAKSLERLFYRHIGVAPKKFAGIIRFFKAHKDILHNGLQDLVTTSLKSGYFDQPHFNREFKKLTGTSPTSDTMSILYKNRID